VFWVISAYFNIRNTLPKSDTFLLGHPVYSVCVRNIVLTLVRSLIYCVSSFFCISCDWFIATEFNVPTYMYVSLNLFVTGRSLLINIMCLYICIKYKIHGIYFVCVEGQRMVVIGL